MQVSLEIAKLLDSVAHWGTVHPGWASFLKDLFFTILGAVLGAIFDVKVKANNIYKFFYKNTDKSRHQHEQKLEGSPNSTQQLAEGDIIEDNSGNEASSSISESPHSATSTAGGDISAPIQQHSPHMQGGDGSTQLAIYASSVNIGAGNQRLGTPTEATAAPPSSDPVLSGEQAFIYSDIKRIFNERGSSYDPRTDYEAAVKNSENGSCQAAAVAYIRIFGNTLLALQKIDRFSNAGQQLTALDEAIKCLIDVRDGKISVDNAGEKFKLVEDAVRAILSFEILV